MFVENGDVVKVHYTGKLEDGHIFDSSVGKEPLEFTIGMGMVIDGFENGIIGMKQGETKTVTIPPELAYGQRNEEYKISVDRNNLPPDIEPEIGLGLTLFSPDGQPINVTITQFDDLNITLDANPPLAGKTLIFDLELVGFLKGNLV
ncbi:MAG: FKBP-type peptidyl-prolyl cis-trans isomerase [Candidatus Kapaibacteriota bacterium]|jgi:peptidylprolyl isomerase